MFCLVLLSQIQVTNQLLFPCFGMWEESFGNWNGCPALAQSAGHAPTKLLAANSFFELSSSSLLLIWLVYSFWKSGNVFQKLEHLDCFPWGFGCVWKASLWFAVRIGGHQGQQHFIGGLLSQTSRKSANVFIKISCFQRHLSLDLWLSCLRQLVWIGSRPWDWTLLQAWWDGCFCCECRFASVKFVHLYLPWASCPGLFRLRMFPFVVPERVPGAEPRTMRFVLKSETRFQQLGENQRWETKLSQK